MTHHILLVLLYGIVLLLEASIIPFPFVFIFSLLLLIYFRSHFTEVVVLSFALMLDVLRMHTIGITPLMIFSVLFLMDLYRYAFNTRDKKFILIILAVSSLIYAQMVRYEISPILYGVHFLIISVSLFVLSKMRRAIAAN